MFGPTGLLDQNLTAVFLFQPETERVLLRSFHCGATARRACGRVPFVVSSGYADSPAFASQSFASLRRLLTRPSPRAISGLRGRSACQRCGAAARAPEHSHRTLSGRALIRELRTHDRRATDGRVWESTGRQAGSSNDSSTRGDASATITRGSTRDRQQIHRAGSSSPRALSQSERGHAVGSRHFRS